MSEVPVSGSPEDPLNQRFMKSSQILAAQFQRLDKLTDAIVRARVGDDVYRDAQITDELLEMQDQILTDEAKAMEQALRVAESDDRALEMFGKTFQELEPREMLLLIIHDRSFSSKSDELIVETKLEVYDELADAMQVAHPELGDAELLGENIQYERMGEERRYDVFFPEGYQGVRVRINSIRVEDGVLVDEWLPLDLPEASREIVRVIGYMASAENAALTLSQ